MVKRTAKKKKEPKPKPGQKDTPNEAKVKDVSIEEIIERARFHPGNKQFRLNVIEKMLLNGLSREEIKEFAMREWSVSGRTIDRYAAQVEKEWAAQETEKRQKQRAKEIKRMRDWVWRAVKQENFAEARRCQDVINRLLGLYENFDDLAQDGGLPDGFDEMTEEGQTVIVSGLIRAMYRRRESWDKDDHRIFMEYMTLLRRVSKQEIDQLETVLDTRYEQVKRAAAKQLGVPVKDFQDALVDAMAHEIEEEHREMALKKAAGGKRK